MPQVFEVASIITRIESIQGGWVGGGGVGGGGELSNRNGSAVPSVGDPDWYNSNGEPGLPSESVWHPMPSY